MKNILYIEDDVDDQSIFEDALDILAMGLRYDIVSDGKTAIEKLNSQQQPFDLILLDLNMPLFNGFDLLRTLKHEESFKKIPVYILSTSASKKDRKACEELGANGFITKPHDFKEYCRKLNEVILTVL